MATLSIFAGLAILPAGVWILGLIQSLPNANLDTGIKIYDGQNKLACIAYADDKLVEPVRLGEVSPWLRKAVIVSEDQNFYRHEGVSLAGTIRALTANIASGRIVQGGSTITQQLAKNVFFRTASRTFVTKLKEAVVAVTLDYRYSKDQILESYLNHIYFGHGVYGIERAARTYFGKAASELTLAESCYLVSLISAPSKLSLPANRKAVLELTENLLQRMVDEKEITASQAEQVRKRHAAPIALACAGPASSFYTSYVLQKLHQRYNDKNLWTSGFHVYTYLDTIAQAQAEDVLNKGVLSAPNGVSEGALVAVSVPNGAVIAMVGSAKGFNKSQWNRAIHPHTTGSVFKPFVYLAGLTSGVLAADSIILDAPLSYRSTDNTPYNPSNYDGRYLGWITIRKALALSRNTTAVRVGLEVGPERVVETARACGIHSPMDATPSIALGSNGASPLEIAGAFSTLARGGLAIEPAVIRKIANRENKVLEERSVGSVRVCSDEPVNQLIDAMQDVVEHGTGKKARLWNRPVAGKTGTSDGPRDLWFVGFTPDLVTAVWAGNDDNRPIPGMHVTGGTVVAAIWQEFMKSYYQAHPTPSLAFTPPSEPLIEDAEPLHFLPRPAGIFNKIFSFIGESLDSDLDREFLAAAGSPGDSHRQSPEIRRAGQGAFRAGGEPTDLHGEETERPHKSKGASVVGRLVKKVWKAIF